MSNVAFYFFCGKIQYMGCNF